MRSPSMARESSWLMSPEGIVLMHRTFLRLTPLLLAALMLVSPTHAQEPEQDDAIPSQESAQVEVLNWTVNTLSKRVEVSGRVRNLTLGPLHDVVVSVRLLTNQGHSFVSGRALISRGVLESGQASSFKIDTWLRSPTAVNSRGNFEIRRATFAFREAGGRQLTAKNASGRPGEGGGSGQLAATDREVDQRLEERRQAEAEEARRAAPLMPAWWTSYDAAVADLKEAEAVLRAAYQAEGRADNLQREINGLVDPLLKLTRTLKPAPDSNVQARVAAMVLKFANMVDSAEGKAWFQFGEQYREAVAMLDDLDKNR